MVSKIQSIIFNKHEWKLKDAKKWLKIHGKIPIKKVHETKNYYRFRLKLPHQFKKFRMEPLYNHTVYLVLGFK